MVKVIATMKRLFTLMALLGLAVGIFTGCNQSGGDTKSTDTNAPATPPASTNN
jgi:hypothetical protein